MRQTAADRAKTRQGDDQRDHDRGKQQHANQSLAKLRPVQGGGEITGVAVGDGVATVSHQRLRRSWQPDLSRQVARRGARVRIEYLDD